jgi:NAD(P)-dependent dehydrogenase (short-subunit alcohol dehydrogenase family)
MDIKDSVILITGAAQRVGRAVSISLASHGANIAFSYYADDEPWQETIKDIAAHGVHVFAQKVDVTRAASVQVLIQNVLAEFGHIDVLINNASVWLKKPVLQITEAEWDIEMDVNLKGPFLMAQAVAPIMQACGKGLIVNITDLSAFQTWDGYAHHSAAKAGLVALTKVLALELAPAIRVNAIAPGTVQ